MSEAIQGERPGEKRDFPEYIPPLLVKELRQGLRTRGFVLFMILFPLLMSIPFFFYMMLGDDGMSKEVINVFFWIGLVLVFVLFNPLRALYSVEQEKKTRSDELIMMTHISSSRIILEKWLSYTLQTVLLVMMVLPFFLLRYFLGGVDLLQELSVMAVMFLLSCLLTAKGLWISGMPLAYRVLFGIVLVALVCSAVPVIVQIVESRGTSPLIRLLNILEKQPILFLSIIVQVLAGVYISCKGLLILASRWFAAVSENTSCPLRKLLFTGTGVVWVAFLVGLFFNYVSKPSNMGGFMVLFSICCVVPLAFFLLEMILPASCHPAHLKKLKKEGGWAGRVRPLFLPGWQSAGMGFIFLSLVFLGLVMVAYYSTTTGKDDGNQILRLLLLVIANILFFAVAFQPLYKRVGIHSVLCFVVEVGIFWLMTFVSYEALNGNMKEIFSVLPIGCFIDIGNIKVSGSVVAGNYIFVAGIFLLFILASLPFWKKYRRAKAMLKSREE